MKICQWKRLAKYAHGNDLYDIFHLPLSTIANEEFHKLQDEIEAIQLNDNQDTWKFYEAMPPTPPEKCTWP